MDFFKNIFEVKKQKQEFIHDKFTHTTDNFWFWNKKWDTFIPPKYKVGFAFNEKTLLDDCEFICKIGKNTESKEFQYYGLIFGNDNAVDYTQQEVLNYVQKFDEKVLFNDLDYEGVSNDPNGIAI
jgi:hypothetical protein